MAKRYELENAPKMPCYFKEWRDSLDWTQEELASKMDTTVAMVSRIETGERDWGKNYLEAFGYVIGCHPLAPLVSPPRGDVDVSAVLYALSLTSSDFDALEQSLRSLARSSGQRSSLAAKPGRSAKPVEI